MLSNYSIAVKHADCGEVLMKIGERELSRLGRSGTGGFPFFVFQIFGQKRVSITMRFLRQRQSHEKAVSVLLTIFIISSLVINACAFLAVSNSPFTASKAVRRKLPSVVLFSIRNNNNPDDATDDDDKNILSNDEIARYSRHLVLGDVGMTGQLALKRSSVLVIGAGGLGSPCLLYLAAAGVGHIGIVDADTVDASNLQRQIIHGSSTIGMTKCASAAARLMDVNPLIQVRVYEEEFTAGTARRILGQGFAEDRPYDIVIDGSDNFPTKYLIK
jgi:hypothetical protein